MKGKWLNYFGQLRLYSLVDMILMMYASQAPFAALFGAMMLHIGFLAFLESRHKQPGRAPVSEDLPWVVCSYIGMRYFGDHIEAGIYICCSILYSMKNRGRWGLLSPFFRGAQIFLLTVPFADFWFAVLAAVATAVRNVLGDLRDVVADRQDNMKTWPVILRIKEDWLFFHLAATLATTWLWWSFTSISVFCPASLTLIELRSYYLTPRSSNQKALAVLQRLRRPGLVP